MAKKRRKECPLVIIEWEDSSQPEPAWRRVSDVSPDGPLLCASVGWLLHDTKKIKILAQNMGGLNSPADAQVSGVTRIAGTAVRSITLLTER